MRKEEQHTLRTTSHGRTALAHLACRNAREESQTFQMNFISRKEFALKSHTNLASLHFYCYKLFAAEIKNNEREDIDSFWRNSLLVIAEEWTPICFTIPACRCYLMPWAKCPWCSLQPTCSPGLLGSKGVVSPRSLGAWHGPGQQVLLAELSTISPLYSAQCWPTNETGVGKTEGLSIREPEEESRKNALGDEWWNEKLKNISWETSVPVVPYVTVWS